jgi:hypothetical protein
MYDKKKSTKDIVYLNLKLLILFEFLSDLHLIVQKNL